MTSAERRESRTIDDWLEGVDKKRNEKLERAKKELAAEGLKPGLVGDNVLYARAYAPDYIERVDKGGKVCYQERDCAFFQEMCRLLQLDRDGKKAELIEYVLPPIWIFILC